VAPETAGAPTSEQKWVCSSLRHLCDQLGAKGHHVCPTTIGRLLKALDYSLQANVKRLTGAQHPERDAQLKYLESQKQAFLAAGQPVIIVDTKKTASMTCSTTQAICMPASPADTAESAVTMIADWWTTIGRRTFAGANQLLILCDGAAATAGAMS